MEGTAGLPSHLQESLKSLGPRGVVIITDPAVWLQGIIT